MQRHLSKQALAGSVTGEAYEVRAWGLCLQFRISAGVSLCATVQPALQ